MAVAKSTGVKALAKLRAERAELDKREKELRREAAIELGEIVIASGGLDLSPGDLGNVIRLAVKAAHRGKPGTGNVA